MVIQFSKTTTWAEHRYDTSRVDLVLTRNIHVYGDTWIWPVHENRRKPSMFTQEAILNLKALPSLSAI